ncbi:hypothetical protein RZS08_61600, partial [Arthrospira platensis SPKY1]|nr:hypothetical protein [Arthrospira platensis SPKY1]
MSEDIKSWLNSQPYWLQLAAHKSVTDTGITDDAIAEIAEALKAPPDSPEPFDFPNIGTVVNTVEN